MIGIKTKQTLRHMMRGSKKLVLAAWAVNDHIMNPSHQGSEHSSKGGEHVGPSQCEEAERARRKSEAGRASWGPGQSLSVSVQSPKPIHACSMKLSGR